MKRTVYKRTRKDNDGFQPTYEELKPSPPALDVDDVACFQPTYEELKQSFAASSGPRMVGFQPTYEELKLLDERPEIVALLVFSLPTRN